MDASRHGRFLHTYSKKNWGVQCKGEERKQRDWEKAAWEKGKQVLHVVGKISRYNSRKEMSLFSTMVSVLFFYSGTAYHQCALSLSDMEKAHKLCPDA